MRRRQTRFFVGQWWFCTVRKMRLLPTVAILEIAISRPFWRYFNPLRLSFYEQLMYGSEYQPSTEASVLTQK